MRSAGIAEIVVSLLAASYYLGCDRNLLIGLKNSKMAHYGFVFPKSLSILLKYKIRYFNF